MPINRRHFIKQSATVAAGISFLPNSISSLFQQPAMEISLAQWSLHKALFAKTLDNLDFPAKAKNDFGISVVEYVNQFFKDKARDTTYLNELRKRCNDNGVTNHLIMIDGEGYLGDTNAKQRMKAVENHYKWVDAAKYLGCVTIRVNAHGEGTAEEVKKAAADGLSTLGAYGKKLGINVIVENHGGYSSNGQWLADLMKTINQKNIGTLPDFGNFCLKKDKDNNCLEEYDRYLGTLQMLPYAKGVSAKTYNFDETGNCKETDYKKMLQVLKGAAFSGYIGIEYEGDEISEDEGIRKTKELLVKTAAEVGYTLK